jgi:RluA family pseudouridine synthase
MDLTAVIHEDEQILIINKPSGLLSIQDGYDRALPHVASQFQPHFGKLWIVHRLDRETSGILILARTKTAHRLLSLQFEHRQITKIYYAILIGKPKWENVILDHPLLVDGDRSHRTIVSPIMGKPALTECTVLERIDQDFTLLSAHPKTGYTHQIRAHLAAQGFPILNDTLYGSSRHTYQLPLTGLALHAHSITFIHPGSGAQVTFHASLPQDWTETLKMLKSVKTWS